MTEIDRSLTGPASRAITAGASVFAVPGAVVVGVDFAVNGLNHSVNRELGGLAVFIAVALWGVTEFMLLNGLLPTNNNRR